MTVVVVHGWPVFNRASLYKSVCSAMKRTEAELSSFLVLPYCVIMLPAFGEGAVFASFGSS